MAAGADSPTFRKLLLTTTAAMRAWSAGRLGYRVPPAAMSRGLIAGPPCDQVNTRCTIQAVLRVLRRDVASGIAGGLTVTNGLRM